MHTRPILAALLLFSALPVQAALPDSGGGPLAFEKRAVAILNAGGTTDTIEGRLNAIGSGIVLTDDQRVAVDALKLLVRSRTRPDGMSMADAEAFAARNPTSPASAMLLAEAALADHQPQRSADTLIEIAPKAGSLIQLVSPTAVSKLTDELDAISDRQRISGLAKALLYARWGRGSISLRSYLALAAMRDELAAGHVERARALLALVKSPATLHEMLIDGRLAPLQANVEQAAGPRLEKAWRDYLTATRDDWTSRADALSATGYVEALKQANQYDALVDAFLLRFLKGYNCPSDTVARSIGSDLADSLAKTNRWAKAEDIMRRSGGVSQPIYATMLLERGDFGRAASLYERSLKAADAPKGKKEEKALAWLRAADDCAAFRSGGGGSTASYDPALLDVSARLFVLLCLNRPSEAKAALIAALADENERADALRWVQPFNDPPVQSKFRAEMNEKIRAMQRDADVLAVVSRYGRVLDWPFTSAVPTTDELAVAKAGGAWQCGDQSNWQAGMPEVESVHLPDSQQ